jgi:hypothetical protein
MQSCTGHSEAGTQSEVVAMVPVCSLAELGPGLGDTSLDPTR